MGVLGGGAGGGGGCGGFKAIHTGAFGEEKEEGGLLSCMSGIQILQSWFD